MTSLGASGQTTQDGQLLQKTSIIDVWRRPEIRH